MTTDRSPDHLCSVVLECGHWQKDDVIETHPQFDMPDEPVWCYECGALQLMEPQLRQELHDEQSEKKERERRAEEGPPEWA